MNTNTNTTAAAGSSSLVNDDSLRAERTYENAPTNRVKHVALSKRRELYKKQMGDVSQVVSSLTSSSSSSSSKRGDERRGSSSSNSMSSDESSAATVPPSSGKKGSSSRHEEIVDPLVKSWHGRFSLDDLPKLPSATITSIHEEDDDVPAMSKRQGSASTATPTKSFQYKPVRQQRRRPARRVSMESDSSISIGSLFSNDEDKEKKVTPTKDDFSRSDASLDKKKSSRRDTHPSSPTTNKKSNRRRASDATAATAPLYDSDSSNRESSNLFNLDPTLHGPESSPPTSVASSQVQVTKPKVRSRRATVDNSAVSAPKVTLRRKYQPRHRSMANGSVQSIVKPSRYTRCGGSETGSVTSVTSSKSVPTSFASLSKKEETKDQQPSSRRRMFKRRASLPDKISRPQLSGSFTQLKPREITKLKNLSIDLDQVDQESNCSPNVIPSSDDSSSSGDTTLLSDTEEYTEEGESKIKRITSTSSMSSCAAAVDTSNDSWIPHGVDFSASMEVYVFEKYQHKI